MSGSVLPRMSAPSRYWSSSRYPSASCFSSSSRFGTGEASLMYQSPMIAMLVHKKAFCGTRLIKTVAVYMLLLLIALGCSSTNAPDLKDGDLLFVVNGNGNNITDVTVGVDGLGIDHVAVYAEGNVIEAIPESGVVESPLDSFLVRLSENETVLVGRVEGLDVRASVDNARRLLGLPYDDIFMPGDSAVYCSELVQMSFVFSGQRERGAADGTDGTDGENSAAEAVFATIPMSFHDSTGRVTEFWTKFYAARGLAVPEGEPGTNPGQLSRDPNVRILGRLAD